MRENVLFKFLLSFSLLFHFYLSNAGTYEVTVNADSGPGSLREAVAISLSGDTIVFNSSTDGSPVLLTSGEVLIDKSLVVIGNGINNTIISSAGASRVFNVLKAGTVEFQFLTITEGGGVPTGACVLSDTTSLSLFNVVISQGVANGDMPTQGGGGLTIIGGDANIFGTTFLGNTASGVSGSGGGLLILGGAIVSINASSFSINHANRAGGGIELNGGATANLILANIELVSNTTGSNPGNGGGLHITGLSNCTLTGGLISENTAAAEGGGLWNGTGTMNIDGALIRNNVASGAGADQGGGGVFNAGGTIIISNETQIIDNIANGAAGSGGGILNDVGSTLTVMNSIISGNMSQRAGGGIEDNAGTGKTVTLQNVNLINNVTMTSPGNGGGFHITGLGNADIIGGVVSGNTAGAEGGGLWNGTGTMTIQGTVITNNTASGAGADQGGGGVFNAGGTIMISDNTEILNNIANGMAGSGGGILNDVNSTLTVMNSIIMGNTSQRAGGGIEDNAGAGKLVTLINVELVDNITMTSPGNGGGFHITGLGSADVIDCLVSGNSAGAEGGGLWNGTGTMTISNTIIENNTASGASADQGGGGVFNAGGSVIISDSTWIMGNIADGASGSGGGILNDVNGNMTISNSTISSNISQRAGGGIEDNAGGPLMILTDVNLLNNTTMTSPGNGGGFHITGPGNATITGGEVSGNAAGSEGGGLWNGTGTMNISGVLILNNVASGAGADQGGGGVFNAGGTINISDNTQITGNTANGSAGSGGGILNDANSTLTVMNSTLSDNVSNRAGGAIEDNSGAATIVTLINVNMFDNRTLNSPGNGGGFHITGPGNAEITGGVVSGNSAGAEGGGLWNGTGTMNVINTMITNNTASGNGADQGGGGVFNAGGTLNIIRSVIAENDVDGDGNGGGVHNDAMGVMEIHYSTISGNSSTNNGGGITNAGSLLSISNTITNNTATIDGGGVMQRDGGHTLTLRSTILAGNNAAGTGTDLTGFGEFNSQGYNLLGVDDGDIFLSLGSDIEGSSVSPINANLGPLADNGGGTMTHALLCPSPAINAGDNSDISTDQRGMEVFGTQRDIGAFELQELCDPNSTTGVIGSSLGSEVFPNPITDNLFYVEIPDEFGADVQINILELSSGKLLLSTQGSPGTNRIELTGATASILLVQISSDQSIESHKVMHARQ